MHPELTGKLSLKAFAFEDPDDETRRPRRRDLTLRSHGWPLRDPLYAFLPWLNACWLRVEVGSLLDLEFCLGWTRVYLWIVTIEITFEGKSLDLS